MLREIGRGQDMGKEKDKRAEKSSLAPVQIPLSERSATRPQSFLSGNMIKLTDRGGNPPDFDCTSA